MNTNFLWLIYIFGTCYFDPRTLKKCAIYYWKPKWIVWNYYCFTDWVKNENEMHMNFLRLIDIFRTCNYNFRTLEKCTLIYVELEWSVLIFICVYMLDKIKRKTNNGMRVRVWIFLGELWCYLMLFDHVTIVKLLGKIGLGFLWIKDITDWFLKMLRVCLWILKTCGLFWKTYKILGISYKIVQGWFGLFL